MWSWLRDTVLGQISLVLLTLIVALALAVPIALVLFYWMLHNILYMANWLTIDVSF